MVPKNLISIYQKLYTAFGRQNWWPGETKDEIIIGAILTQSVNWKNVEKAIINLKQNDLCSLKAIHNADLNEIANRIKPTLYYNQKAAKLKSFTAKLFSRFNGSLDEFLNLNIIELRTEFLQINGIGPETADSIILYAAEKPIFVIDVYTKRIFSRLGLIDASTNYEEVQKYFMKNLPLKVKLFKDFHAQIVKLAKDFCTKKNPFCGRCPLSKTCLYKAELKVI